MHNLLSDDDAFDERRIAELEDLASDGDPQWLRQVFETFVSDTVRKLHELQDMIDSGDRLGVRQTAHQLKGACRNIGAREMAELCLALENGAAERKNGASSGHLTNLTRAFERVRQRLDQESCVKVEKE